MVQIADIQRYSDLGKVPPEFWRGFPSVRGKSIFIKPNLVVPPIHTEIHSITNVAVVQLLVEKLLSDGAVEIVIGECAFKGHWEETLALSGYLAAFRHLAPRVKLVYLQSGGNFENFTLIRNKEYLSLYGVRVSDYLLNADIVFSVPKLKIHALAMMTGAIKNMMGTITQKGSLHPKNDVQTFHKRLRDFFFLFKDRVHYCLVDGIVGLGYAEHTGIPTEAGVLIAGPYLFPVDCTCAILMGMPPDEIPYLRYIHQTDPEQFPYPIIAHHVVPFEKPLKWKWINEACHR